MSRLRRLVLIAIVLAVTAAAVSAAGETGAWDCPECGRTGNTGNFCGSCGSPAPQTAAPTAGGSPAVAVGDIILFGKYEQDNNPGNGREAIEWIVLDVQGESALLLSRYALDVRAYNTRHSAVTWETCTLRKWLNSVFLKEAFITKEQKAIQRTWVKNDSAQGFKEGWSTNGGNSTQDMVFLLSYAEAHKYIGLDWDWDSGKNAKSRVTPTAYAIAKGAHPAKDLSTGAVWLRSPGPEETDACVSTYNGYLSAMPVETPNYCIRPAIWIDLNSEYFQSDPITIVP